MDKANFFREIGSSKKFSNYFCYIDMDNSAKKRHNQRFLLHYNFSATIAICHKNLLGAIKMHFVLWICNHGLSIGFQYFIGLMIHSTKRYFTR